MITNPPANLYSSTPEPIQPGVVQYVLTVLTSGLLNQIIIQIPVCSGDFAVASELTE